MTVPLGQLAELIRQRTGIEVKPTQFLSLAAAVERAAPGVEGMSVLRATANGDPELIDRLIDEITVHETYFLRAPRELETIDWSRIGAAARGRGDPVVRIWSAACSTGEEAYTLAMLAIEALDPMADDPRVSVLGTDISPAVLAQARSGRYRANAARHLDAERRSRWVRQRGEELVVDDRLRGVVRFARHNLARDPAPPRGESPFDLIVCRNVFMYLEPRGVQHALTELERALVPGGELLLGAVDRLCGTAHGAPRVPIAPPSFASLAPARRSRERRSHEAEPSRRARRTATIAPVAPDLTEVARERFASPVERVQALFAVVDGWSLDETLRGMSELLDHDPLDADAYYLRGIAELSVGDTGEAVASLRRALYLRPDFALAAFKLGRAYDTMDDGRAARRAYEQALRTLDPDDELIRVYAQRIDLGDIAAACRARLNVLAISE